MARAPVAVLLPRPALRVESVTVTVSGYPALGATRLWLGDTMLMTTTLAADAARWTPHGPTRPPLRRCGNCRAWTLETQLADTRLGFGGDCAACVAALAAACQRRHGRLPRAGEFYCRACRQILPAHAHCPPERDGRQRRRCRACRKAQVKAAERRRGL